MPKSAILIVDDDSDVRDSLGALLESANFEFVSVRRTMRQFDLPSEASIRFSRGVPPETVRPAAERAAELMRQFSHTHASVASFRSPGVRVLKPPVRMRSTWRE